MVDTFPPGHFYSPIPNPDDLHSSRFVNTFANILVVEDEVILPLARKVFSYSGELASIVDSGATKFSWCNSQFPPADALAYYGMLRILKPKQIVEIGSGFSTQVAFEAINKNGHGQITCIEPYPQDFLKRMDTIRLIDKKLQDASHGLFSELQASDVLFVDSSHQVKCQSDVLDVFFRVLDRINVGVLIHFHDIFLPDDYPPFWLKERGVFFNEQYFLLAFLKDNPKYRIRLPNAYLVRKHRTTYEDWVSGVHQPTNDCFVNLAHQYIKAGSFWIEKIAR